MKDCKQSMKVRRDKVSVLFEYSLGVDKGKLSTPLTPSFLQFIELVLVLSLSYHLGPESSPGDSPLQSREKRYCVDGG